MYVPPLEGGWQEAGFKKGTNTPFSEIANH